MSFTETPTTPLSPAKLIARSLLLSMDNEHDHDIEVLKFNWESVWENPEATPQEVFNELGTKGLRLLQGGAAQVANLTQQATIMGTTVEALVGNPKYLSAPLPYTINPDNSITITES